MNRREFNFGLVAALGATGLWSPKPQSIPQIDAKRLISHLIGLAEFGKNPQGGVSRVAYSEADLQGRRYVIELMRVANLETTIDAAGNIIGSRPGKMPGLSPILMGSHIDSVPEGGNYDGDVGSLGAIEVAQALAERGVLTRHPFKVMIFQNEEGGTIGSMAATVGLSPQQLELVANSGKTIRDGIRHIGGDPDRLDSARLGPGSFAAYLELHIEQGGVLEAEKTNIGVVEGIVGIRDWDVTVMGFANHAGTTPMNQRRDAMLAAARFVDAVNRVVTSLPGRQVGTVGKLTAQPGAYNVIPGKVVLGFELRDLDDSKIDLLYSRIHDEAQRIGAETHTSFEFTLTNAIKPAPTDPGIREAISRTARKLGLTTRTLPSGAGHDAQELARLGPAGMIFIPSRGGISHSPAEYSTPGDIASGANVLLATLLELDATL
jgi:N-carbamoyl-L-amino-acid hydrolase